MTGPLFEVYGDCRRLLTRHTPQRVPSTSRRITMSTATDTLTGTWVGDTVHSDISFKVRHMAVGKARGTFALESATLTVPESGLADATVTAVIDAVSVDTKQDQRNEHVKSPDFLHVEQYPTLTFKSTGIKNFDTDEFVVVGDLTIRGITKSVELATEF